MRSRSIDEALTGKYGALGWHAVVEDIMGGMSRRVVVSCRFGEATFISGPTSRGIAIAAFAAGEAAMLARMDSEEGRAA